MADRYEMVDVGTRFLVVAPGTELGADVIEEHALVIGNPDMSALVVVGTLTDLEELLEEMLAEVRAAAA